MPFPIDPGAHSLTFEAPGHKPRTESVNVQDTQTVRVVVEPLEPLPAVEALSPPAPPAPPPPVAAAPAPQPTVAEAPVSAPGGGLRTLGWVVGGVGVVGLGVGTGLALNALSLQHQADAICPNKLCPPKGTSLVSDATTSANLATAGFAVGLVGLAAGAWLVIQPLRASGKASARLTPYFGPDRAGIAMDGAW